MARGRRLGRGELSQTTGTLTVEQGSLLWQLLGERTSVSVEGLLGQFDFTGTIAIVGAPTAVRLLSFTARHSAPGVVLRWRTAAGSRLLGVNVYRGNKRLNRRLLETSGRFLDRSAPRGMTYTYRLQAVALDGTRVWLATATAA